MPWLIAVLQSPTMVPCWSHPWVEMAAPLQVGSLLLSMVLIAPYPEMLPLACLQETLH